MKATCYHARRSGDKKVMGGSLGMSRTNEVDLNTAAQDLARRMEIAVLPSGRATFMLNGEPVSVYLSVDPAETEKGKAALRAHREAMEKANRAAAELAEEQQQALDDAVGAIGIEQAIELLKKAGSK